MSKKNSKSSAKSKKSSPKITFPESVHNEYPAETVKKLTDETMQHLIRVADPNLKKWGYSLMKIRVEEYWKRVGQEALNVKREQLRHQKAYPSLQKKKKQKIEETKETNRKATIRISEDVTYLGCRTRLRLIISPQRWEQDYSRTRSGHHCRCIQ